MENDENNIEPEDFDQQGALTNMGKMGLVVFRSILRDGGTWNEAFAITGAFFAGSMKAMMDDGQ